MTQIPQPAFVMPGVPQPAPQIQAPPPAGPVPASHPVINIEQYVEKYRLLRDKKAEVNESIKDTLKAINSAMEQIEAIILDALNKQGLDSVKTGAGTAFKSTRSSYTVRDPAAFREWLAENNRFDLLETRVSKEAIEELLKDGGQLPPGLGISSEITLNIRK